MEGQKTRRRTDLKPYALILPVLILCGFFTIYPFAQALYYSFINYVIYKPQEQGQFLGFKNYQIVVTSSFFREAMMNTVMFTAFSVSSIVLIAIGVSLVLNQKFRGAGFVRAVMLIPWAIPPAAAGLIWRYMFQSTGWINKVMVDSGLWKEAVYFLAAPRFIQVAYAVVAQLWQQLPFSVLLLLAVMQLIPKDIHDSAEVDGASGFKKFRYITLPFIKSAVGLVAAFQAFLALTTYDLVFAFAGGAFGLISYYTFAATFTWGNFGQGAALGVILALLSLGVIFVILRIVPPEKLYRYSFTGE